MTYKTCGELFSGIDCTIIGNPEEPVSGIAYRSDAVKPGDAFCCIVGLKADGHSFAQDAIDRGARVLIVERKVYLADATEVTEVVVKDSRKAMARLASRFYGNPSEAFSLVGVTGTNGKTTTTYLVNHIAQVLGNKTGLIGTVGIEIEGQHRPSSHTTPESPDLQKLFAMMRDEGCGVVSMEVSSHALDLERTWATKFAVTAFTNLTQDHLDYHKTFEAYFSAKARLFSKDYPAKRVINIDSAWGKELLKRTSTNEDVIVTTGFDPSAQIHPVEVEYGAAQTRVELSVRGTNYAVTYPLVGRFNVENVMTAFGVALQLGYAPSAIVEALRDVPAVPGRLQRVSVENDGGISVYVDYAHTPDALEKAIASVSALESEGKTIVVDPMNFLLRNLGSRNNTIIHECVHWVEHRKVFELERLFNASAACISCEVVGGAAASVAKKATEMMERQANALAPRIQMPAEPFKAKANEYIGKFMRQMDAKHTVDVMENV